MNFHLVNLNYPKRYLLVGASFAAFLVFVTYGTIFTILDLEGAREEIKVADCKQLLDIYLDDEGKYLPSSEQVAKKHFDVKCVANPYLEAIP